MKLVRWLTLVMALCACRCALAAVEDGSDAWAAVSGGWRMGRATFYGAPGDRYSIHDGSCTHKYLWPDVGTGWDTGAMDDQAADFSCSCGRCYEIRCDARDFTDGYGAILDRNTVCYNTTQTLVITVTDSCPCRYPNNAYSNRRWCCGDVDHFDLSIWAFEKLASVKWGVIALKYRPVPCSYVPANKAPRPAKFTPGIPPPPGAVHP